MLSLKRLKLGKKLGKVASKATEEKLFACKSVWPPWAKTSTVVTEKAITSKFRDWWIKSEKTMLLTDLSSVEVVTGPYFGTAVVKSKYITTTSVEPDDENKWEINWLRARDANKLKQISMALKAKTSPEKDQAIAQGEAHGK